ncbi:hypothetical protein U1872_08055 [Sphingomonas sp. RB3P16]|uniref:hypothetical protein n=1 Tax=Parasphingomonas frigoris TaxID=3096163 RepID=UPI002FCAED99
MDDGQPAKKASGFALPESVKPIVDFAVHVVVGAVVVATIMVVAACLAGVVHVIRYFGFQPTWFTEPAELAEKSLFFLDLFLGGLFLAVEALKLIYKLALAPLLERSK